MQLLQQGLGPQLEELDDSSEDEEQHLLWQPDELELLELDSQHFFPLQHSELDELELEDGRQQAELDDEVELDEVGQHSVLEEVELEGGQHSVLDDEVELDEVDDEVELSQHWIDLS